MELADDSKPVGDDANDEGALEDDDEDDEKPIMDDEWIDEAFFRRRSSNRAHLGHDDACQHDV
jgi:hypothetical protein